MPPGDRSPVAVLLAGLRVVFPALPAARSRSALLGINIGDGGGHRTCQRRGQRRCRSWPLRRVVDHPDRSRSSPSPRWSSTSLRSWGSSVAFPSSRPGTHPALMTVLLVALFIGDHPALFRGFEQHRMTLNEVYTDRATLETRLSTELGSSVGGSRSRRSIRSAVPPPWTSLPAADRRRRAGTLLLAVALTAVVLVRRGARRLVSRHEPVVARPRSTTSRHRRRRPSLERSIDELFDPATLHVRVRRRGERPAVPRQRPTEEYVPATMTFDGETIDVTSATRDRSRVCGMRPGPNLFDPSGGRRANCR